MASIDARLLKVVGVFSAEGFGVKLKMLIGRLFTVIEKNVVSEIFQLLLSVAINVTV